MKLSAIILAMTTTEELFVMTLNAINSLIASEPNVAMEIIVVESNKNYLSSGFKYPEFVTVIIPNSDFNFHKFLNIGIKASKGEYVALCNNDLIFHKNWFSEILMVSIKHFEILSFSPIGTSIIINKNDNYEIGYKVMTHIKGWCIVIKKELFQKIGLLDETFNFYFADNDYAMTLKSKNIKHALVYKSHVTHLEKQSTNTTTQKKILAPLVLAKYKIPKYLKEEKYLWVFDNENNLAGFLKFHKKWGTPNLLYKKNKLADILMKYKLGFLNRFIFKLKI